MHQMTMDGPVQHFSNSDSQILANKVPPSYAYLQEANSVRKMLPRLAAAGSVPGGSMGLAAQQGGVGSPAHRHNTWQYGW